VQLSGARDAALQKGEAFAKMCTPMKSRADAVRTSRPMKTTAPTELFTAAASAATGVATA
jgi:hypothetical protein